jgi:anthranilate synthase component 2
VSARVRGQARFGSRRAPAGDWLLLTTGSRSAGTRDSFDPTARAGEPPQSGEDGVLLLIDNYDSFTWNLYQYLSELGAETLVRRNDEVDEPAIEALAPERIVLSPGPCTPAEAGVSVDCVRRFGSTTPMLGVCLGHQAIAAAYGGRVVRADRPMHGKVSAVAHTGADLFAGLPNPMEATRYHSLIVARDGLPEELEVIAWTGEEGWTHEIQGMRHRRHPVWGVQFHPESIATTHGKDLIANFLRLSAA